MSRDSYATAHLKCAEATSATINAGAHACERADIAFHGGPRPASLYSSNVSSVRVRGFDSLTNPASSVWASVQL